MPGNVFGKQRQFTRFLIRALALYKVSQVFPVHVPHCIALKTNFVEGEGTPQWTSTAIRCVHLEISKNVPLYLTLAAQSLKIFRVFRIYSALSLFMSSNVFILAIKYINSPATKHPIESIPSLCWADSLEKGKKLGGKKGSKSQFISLPLNSLTESNSELSWGPWFQLIGEAVLALFHPSKSSGEVEEMWGKHQEAAYSRLPRWCPRPAFRMLCEQWDLAQQNIYLPYTLPS